MVRPSPCVRLALIGVLGLVACNDAASPGAPGATGEIPSPAAVGTTSASAPLSLLQVSAGQGFTCAVTADSVPYCWGDNMFGRLGVGDTTGPERCEPSGTLPCSTKPVPVAGAHRFGRVSAGYSHACGVTADFQAWCWGDNIAGQLGDGTTHTSLAPVQVPGLRFRQVDAGLFYTCGVTYPDSHLYCWGQDLFGKLGIGPGSNGSAHPTPAAVLTTLTFRQVNAGASHTCAITVITGRAFCWGRNVTGEVGDSTNVRIRDQPSEVVGKHVFRQIEVGGEHTCAVTITDQAFCWGNGRQGAIGNGHAYLSFWPRAVSGGLRVRRVTAGERFNCAETTANKAYCWGFEFNGELGNGGSANSVALTPVPVGGGHAFAQLSAGQSHVCGKVTLGFGWCWGYDYAGDLGDGFTGLANRLTPVQVLGP
jgi:alpha-tubulin suppressor-like RCC1 family protein